MSNHIEVKSSNLKSIAYDPVDRKLSVRFRCGDCAGEGFVPGRGSEGEPDGETCSKCGGRGHTSEYHYTDVDDKDYAALRDAPSPGKAFHSVIRGKYQGVKG